MSILIPENLSELRKLAFKLKREVFDTPDPTSNPDLFQKFHEVEQKLRQAENELLQASLARLTGSSSKANITLGKDIAFEVGVKVVLDPIPTGFYHLLDFEKEPLVVVTVKNISRDTDNKTALVKAYLEGLSTESVKTVGLKRNSDSVEVKLLPTLFPERVAFLNQVRRATLHVEVHNLNVDKGSTMEYHDTFSVVMLARTSCVNSTIDPVTGNRIDLTPYYGSWVTPQIEEVQELVRRAVERIPSKQFVSYQSSDPKMVEQQVKALYETLQEHGLRYVNSVFDYGATSGQVTQRTRLPRESITQKSANCIDGTVLFASLLEAVSLNPAIVIVPGHAFVAWEVYDGSDQWDYLETTMIGSSPFEAALASARKQYSIIETTNPDRIRRHAIRDLRERRIWPAE